MQHAERDTTQPQNSVCGLSPLDEAEAANLRYVSVCKGKGSGQVCTEINSEFVQGMGGFEQILKHFILFCGCWNYYKNAYCKKRKKRNKNSISTISARLEKRQGRGSDSRTGLLPMCFSGSEKIRARGVWPYFRGSKSWWGITII